MPSVAIIHLDSNYFQTGGNMKVSQKSWHSDMLHMYKFRCVLVIYPIVNNYCVVILVVIVLSVSVS